MSVRELHGIAAKGAIGRYIQTIYIIDGADPETVVVAMAEGGQVAIAADEARFLARLLEEAADRVSPQPEPALVASDPEGIPPVERQPLIAVRNPKGPRIWTVERNELMRLEVPLGRLTREELKAALEALPGPPIPNAGRLGTQAHTLGLKWGTRPEASPAAPEAAQEPVPEPAPEPAYRQEFTPQEFGPADTAPGVAAVPADYRPQPAVRPAFTADRQVPSDAKAMDYEQVKDLAARWGVAFSSWDDLPSVNNKAERLGHPRIERRYGMPRKLHNLDAD